MARIKIDVNEAWIELYDHVMPKAIETLRGLEHQITLTATDGVYDPEDLLQQIHSQMIDLRKHLESISIIF